MLDADILVTAMTEAVKGFDLRRIGPKQSSHSRCKRHDSTLSTMAAPQSRKNRDGSRVCAGQNRNARVRRETRLWKRNLGVNNVDPHNVDPHP
jgi:hypothetical protein